MTDQKPFNGDIASQPNFKPTVKPSIEPSILLPHAPQYSTRGSLPNTPLSVSVISALLGGLSCGALAFASRPILTYLGADQWGWARPQLGLYLLAMGMFHLWEFWTTAGWNPQKLSVDGELSIRS